jgi:hypothetical protein
VFSKATTPTG